MDERERAGKVHIYLEYNCPRGHISCSISARDVRRGGFVHNNQETFSISTPVLICGKDFFEERNPRAPPCIECPNDKVFCSGVTLWFSGEDRNLIPLFIKNGEMINEPSL